VDFDLTADQVAFRQVVREWVERECPKSVARELESRAGEYPAQLWQKMADAGFPALSIPEAYGGQGADLMTAVILQRELARSLAGLTWMWGITAFCAKAIVRYGTDDQRERVLPEVAAGGLTLALAVTEPGGGTDVLGALQTRAERREGGWVLTGTKVWSTGALTAGYLLVLARSDPSAERRSEGVSLFLVPNPSAGLQIRSLPKLGMRALASCEVSLVDVVVPDELVVGTVHRGWHEVMDVVGDERILLAALCCGIIDGVLEDALRYTRERHAFGRPIAAFQAVQHHIAQIVTWQHESELLTWRAAWLSQNGRPYELEADIAKVVSSEAAVAAADTGIQLLGGMGYSLETDMQRYWRDARLFRIGPLTNEMTRNMIGLRLGLPRSW
jgi:acyl-CoA dehydrogenase